MGNVETLGSRLFAHRLVTGIDFFRFHLDRGAVRYGSTKLGRSISCAIEFPSRRAFYCSLFTLPAGRRPDEPPRPGSFSARRCPSIKQSARPAQTDGRPGASIDARDEC